VYIAYKHWKFHENQLDTFWEKWRQKSQKIHIRRKNGRFLDNRKKKYGGNMRKRFFIPDLLFVFCSVGESARTPSARFNAKLCGFRILLKLFLWALWWRSFRVFFSYLVGETQQWTWLLQWFVLCDPAPQRCCLWRGPISRLRIVVVADHKRNDEPLRRMADHARQFRLDLLFFKFLPSLNAHGRKSWKARVVNFGTLAEGEMFCRNSSTA